MQTDVNIALFGSCLLPQGVDEHCGLQANAFHCGFVHSTRPPLACRQPRAPRCYMSFSGTPLGQGRRLDHNTFLGKQSSGPTSPHRIIPTSYAYGCALSSYLLFTSLCYNLEHQLSHPDPLPNPHHPYAIVASTTTTTKTRTNQH